MDEQTAATMEPGTSAETTTPLIRLESVHKTYDLGEVQVHALRGVSLEIQIGRAHV